MVIVVPESLTALSGAASTSGNASAPASIELFGEVLHAHNHKNAREATSKQRFMRSAYSETVLSYHTERAILAPWVATEEK
jgi:hypothetical protein